MNTWKLSIKSSLCDCAVYFLFKKDINKLTEDKKEGLRQLEMTFQHFMREEIQDASQLPPCFDIFEAFAKVSVKFGIFANTINQLFTLYFPVDLWKSRTLHVLYHSPMLMSREWKNALLILKRVFTFNDLSVFLVMTRYVHCQLSRHTLPLHSFSFVMVFQQWILFLKFWGVTVVNKIM